ncbi:MAG: DUF1453 domain-containing protein [Umezawaea sp.]
MSGPVEIVLIIAAIAYIVARRLLGEPAEAKRVLALPAVLTVVGLVDVTKVAQSPVAIGFLVGTTVVSVLLGLLRGASIRVFERDGVAHLKYTAGTLVLWAVNIVLKLGAGFALGVVDPATDHAGGNGLMLTLGAGMVAEGLVVMAKAMGTDGQVLWAKGRRGAPHTTMPVLSRSPLSSTGDQPWRRVRPTVEDGTTGGTRVEDDLGAATGRMPETGRARRAGRARAGDRARRRIRGDGRH